MKEVKESVSKIIISIDYPSFNLYENYLYYINIKLLYKSRNQVLEKNLAKLSNIRILLKKEVNKKRSNI